MSEHTQKQPDHDSFDELLKSALFQDLEDCLPNAEEQRTEPEFSEKFQGRIQALISEAEKTPGKGTEQTAGKEAEKVVSEKPVSETEYREIHKPGAGLEAGTRKADEAMSRMAGKIIPFPALRHHRRALVNAASILLVFGLGVFFLKGGIQLPGSAAGSAASGGAQMEMAAAAPSLEDLTETGAAPSLEALTETGAVSSPETFTETAVDPSSKTLAETAGSPVPAALSETGLTENSAALSKTGSEKTPEALSEAEIPAPAAGSLSASLAADEKNRAEGTEAAEDGAAKPETAAAVSGNGEGAAMQETRAFDAADQAADPTAPANAEMDAGSRARTMAETAQTTQLPNPITEVESAADFADQLGFSMDVYPAAREQETTQYSILSGKLAQIDYESEVLQAEATYRGMKREVLLPEISGAEEMDEKSLADQAYQTLSGVYEVFDETKTESWVGLDPKTGQEVTISVQFVKVGSDNAPFGTDGALATWEQDGIMHSLWVKDAALHPDAVGKEARNLAGLQF